MHKWYVKMEEGAKKYCTGKGVKKDRQLGLKKTGNWALKRQARGKKDNGKKHGGPYYR
jgi:hypothetical protein